MKVEVLLVANHAHEDLSLLTVEGGGWEHYSCPFLPWTVRGFAAGVFTLDDDEVGSTPAVVLDITDQAGHVEAFRASMIVSGVRPATTAGVPCRVPFAVPFTTIVTGPTVVKVVLSHGGSELAAIAFAVLDPVPDAPPTE